MEGFGRLANMFGEGTEGDEDEMPLKYSQNRMAEMGMPGIAQIGEAIVDKIRASRWNKQHPGAGLGPMMGPMAGEEPGAMAGEAPGAPDVATRYSASPDALEWAQRQFSISPSTRRFVGG